MPFTLPQFNITFRTWLPGTTPASDPPIGAPRPCQLYVNSRATMWLNTSDGIYDSPRVFLRAPLDTGALPINSIVGVGPSLSDFYLVLWQQITHAGFPNAYYSFGLQQCNDDGTVPRSI